MTENSESIKLDRSYNKRIMGGNFSAVSDQSVEKYVTANDGWIELYASNWSCSSNNKLDVVNYDPREFIAVGDRIKIGQYPTYTYHVVVKVDEDSIYLASGFSPATINEIYYSKVATPVNYPGSILADYPLVFTTSGVTNNNSELYYYMIGSRIFISFFLDVSTSAVLSTISFFIPLCSEAVSAGLSLDDLGGTQISVGTSLPLTDAKIELNGGSFDITKADLSNWGTRTLSNRVNFELAIN